ncbi:unnamed protein product [Orchesella dallaii]|uniref:Uncharacterized protein n=1 Tax=Orchesella dallaii TaxID=48710 RepID=A0ABP1R4L7_9HEXA
MLQKRHKKKEGQEQGNIGGEHPQGDHGDADFDDDEVAGPCQKQNKKTIKKRGKFVEEDNSKLLTGLEERNVKFVTRRNVLNNKFNAMILEDLDFDYLSFFLENEEENPLRTAKDEENMKSALSISKSDMNPDMGGLPYFPFRQLPKFDPETYDIWGQPFNDADGMREAEILQDPLVPVDADFAYNPEDRPAEYPAELEPKYLNDTFGNGLVNENTSQHDNGIVPVSFKRIPDLDCLKEYFQRVKGSIKESRSKFGWCGPNFVKPKQPLIAIQRPKKPKFRKEPEPIDFCKMDWAEQNRKYNERIAEAAGTKKEDKTIVTLRAGKIIIPYLGFEYEYDFDPVDFENENDAKYVPPIFRLFTNSNQSILDRLTKKTQENASSHYEDGGLVNDNMLPKPSSNHSIEMHINMDEDFISRLENEHDDQFPQRDYNALNEYISSTKFSRKPKPIDMGGLKKGILSSLTRDLGLDELG